ncbi:MAG: hypothetical protein AAB862_02020, partial [Patescibacteria group bacterium]
LSLNFDVSLAEVRILAGASGLSAFLGFLALFLANTSIPGRLVSARLQSEFKKKFPELVPFLNGA